MTKIHKGLMVECSLCSPDSTESRKKSRVRKPKSPATLDIATRRQVALELGEDEPTKDQKYVLLQKFGVVSPKIDRLVTKPSWMSVTEFKRKQNEWYKNTRGMVQPQQQRRARWKKDEPRQRDTNKYPRNYGQTRMENRPRLRPSS